MAAADEFSGLESGQFNAIADTVSAMVASGNPQAGAVIDALEKRHLVYSPAGGVLFGQAQPMLMLEPVSL